MTMDSAQAWALIITTGAGAVVSIFNNIRARRIESKTDAQTVTIDKAATAAMQTEKNTDGALSKLREQLDALMTQYIQSAREHSDHLAALATATKQPAAPTIVVQPVPLPMPGERVAGGRRADDATVSPDPPTEQKKP